MVKRDACLHAEGFPIAIAQMSESQLRSWSGQKQLLCPDCHTALVYRRGERVAAHFAHVTGCAQSGSEPETATHQKGKRLVEKWLQQQFPQNETRCEAVLKETGQRADVLTVFPGGERLAVEVQCSPLSWREMAHRVQRYQTAGVGQLWLLDWGLIRGKSDARGGCIKLPMFAWAMGRFQKGRLYLLDVEQEEIGYLQLCRHVLNDRREVDVGMVWKQRLMEVSTDRCGQLVLHAADRMFEALQLHRERKEKRRQAWGKRLVEQMSAWLRPELVQRFAHKRKEGREQHSLFSVISVFYQPSDYPVMPIFERQMEGDQLFKLDPFLWQSFLFFTEIYRSYTRSSTFSRGRKRPKLFVKRLIHSTPGRADSLFKEQVIDKCINRPLQTAKKIAPARFAAVKDVHEVVYDYLCSLTALGFLANVTPNQETITAKGKLYGKFEVLFDRFYPEQFQTDAGIIQFFQQHQLQFVWREWYDLRTGERFS